LQKLVIEILFIDQFSLIKSFHVLYILMTEYIEAQEKAIKDRLHMWDNGYFTEDDAKKINYVKKIVFLSL